MRLRVPELLKKHGLTAYQLAKGSDGRISMARAYRLARGELSVSSEVLEALCDAFRLRGPGPLFVREPRGKGRR